MTKKEIKQKLFKLLDKDADDLTNNDWLFIHQYLTYDIINDYIDTTGNAVLLEGITIEYPTIISVPVSELLALYEK